MLTMKVSILIILINMMQLFLVKGQFSNILSKNLILNPKFDAPFNVSKQYTLFPNITGWICSPDCYILNFNYLCSRNSAWCPLNLVQMIALNYGTQRKFSQTVKIATSGIYLI